MGRRSRYTEEFHRDAVALPRTADGTRTYAAVTSDLGISGETLRTWVRTDNASGQGSAADPRGLPFRRTRSGYEEANGASRLPADPVVTVSTTLWTTHFGVSGANRHCSWNHTCSQSTAGSGSLTAASGTSVALAAGNAPGGGVGMTPHLLEPPSRKLQLRAAPRRLGMSSTLPGAAFAVAGTARVRAVQPNTAATRRFTKTSIQWNKPTGRIDRTNPRSVTSLASEALDIPVDSLLGRPPGWERFCPPTWRHAVGRAQTLRR